METEEVKTEEYMEDGGVRVVKTTIVRKYIPADKVGKVKPDSNAIIGPIPTNSIPEINSKNLGQPLTHHDPEEKSDQFARDVLKAHNELRELHGAPPLQLSVQLNEYATQWANHLASIEKLNHRTNSPFGENIYFKKGANVKIRGAEPVESWYDEIRMYKAYGGEPERGTTKDWGHFSQVIWKNSQRLGVGKVTANRSVYVVCNYDPPGNVWGRFAANVPPPNKK